MTPGSQGVEQDTVEEISLEAAFADLIDNETLSDVALKGSDGEIVLANRCILASRSKYFRRMLYGEFREGHSAEIELGYEGAVLRCIVEYCCTNKSQLLDKDPEKGLIHTAIELSKAADYYFLPTLAQKVRFWVSKSLDKKPLLAWEVMELTSSAVQENFDEIICPALRIIRSKLSKVLDKGVVQNLSSPVIESVLRDEEVYGEDTKFMLLQMWTEQGSGERKVIAQKLSELLSLSFMKPSLLSHTVASSGLVTDTQLLEAYKQQALMAEEGNMCFRRVRSVPALWESSQDARITNHSSNACTEKLDCAPLEYGIHTWRIRVVELNRYLMSLGVISTTHRFDESKNFIDDQKGGWAYRNDGQRVHAGLIYYNETPNPKFFGGDTVALTLDLTGNGTLGVKVGDGRYIELFSNLLASFKEGQRVSFVPAVTLGESGEVILVDMNSKY